MFHKLLFTLVFSIYYVTSDFPPEIDHGISLPTRKPLIVAHRGASGMLPEHTIPAYKLAMEQGADILECDVSLTRDLNLVCLHESWLSDVTDVQWKFPTSKKSSYYISDIGKMVTDYFSVDFTLEEIKELKVQQRFKFRDQTHNDMYNITTLDELLELINSASRPLGVYVETKHSDWLNNLDVLRKNQTTIERLLVDKLKSFGFTNRTDPCLIQSFNLESLNSLKDLTSLPLVVLLDSFEVTDEELDEWAEFCYAIAPWKGMIIELSDQGHLRDVTDLVSSAHARGLKVHPYTFSNDGEMAWDYGHDPQREYEHFLQTGVDGYFTDHPHTLLHYLNVTYRATRSTTNCENNRRTDSTGAGFRYSVHASNQTHSNSSSVLFTLFSLFITLWVASTCLR